MKDKNFKYFKYFKYFNNGNDFGMPWDLTCALQVASDWIRAIDKDIIRSVYERAIDDNYLPLDANNIINLDKILREYENTPGFVGDYICPRVADDSTVART